MYRCKDRVRTALDQAKTAVVSHSDEVLVYYCAKAEGYLRHLTEVIQSYEVFSRQV